jgi:tRNA(Ile)-lysidine synthase
LRSSTLVRRVHAFMTDWILQLCRSRFAVPMPVLLACSGGPDSAALLVALAVLRDELGLDVHVVCVDHGLRRQAAAEAAAVSAVAARLGLSAEAVVVRCGDGASLQASARAARYAALATLAAQRGARAVLVGHTQQDQSETMLMRWLAGAGLRGLCGMAAERELPGTAARPVALLRPLLTTSRDEIDVLVGQVAEWIAPLPFQDPSNRDRRYQRARLRHDVLPQLRIEQPQLDRHLGQLATQLRDDSDYLEAQADAAYQALRGAASTPAGGDAGERLRLPLAATAALPPALFARVLMRICGGLGHVHIAALRALCADGNGSRSLDLPGGQRVERRYGELLFFDPKPPVPVPAEAGDLQLPGCGCYPLPRGILQLVWQAEATPAGAPLLAEARLSLSPDAFPLTLRAPRPGDRMRLPAGQRKVSDLLIDLKIPRRERHRTRLLCQSAAGAAGAAVEQVLWLVGSPRIAAPPPASAADQPRAVLLARWLASAPGA